MEFFADWPTWAKWLGGIAGALTSLAIIWRLGVVTLARAMWAAILAAPEIADGIHELGELIRGDVLGRIASGDARAIALESRVTEHQAELLHERSRVDELELAVALQRQVVEAYGARITAQELALEALTTRTAPGDA